MSLVICVFLIICTVFLSFTLGVSSFFDGSLSLGPWDSSGSVTLIVVPEIVLRNIIQVPSLIYLSTYLPLSVVFFFKL